MQTLWLMQFEVRCLDQIPLIRCCCRAVRVVTVAHLMPAILLIDVITDHAGFSMVMELSDVDTEPLVSGAPPRRDREPHASYVGRNFCLCTCSGLQRVDSACLCALHTGLLHWSAPGDRSAANGSPQVPQG